MTVRRHELCILPSPPAEIENGLWHYWAVDERRPRLPGGGQSPIRPGSTQNSTPMDALGQLMIGRKGHIRLLPATTVRA